MVQVLVKKPQFKNSNKIVLKTSVQCFLDTEELQPSRSFFRDELYSDEFKEFRLEQITGRNSSDSI